MTPKIESCLVNTRRAETESAPILQFKTVCSANLKAPEIEMRAITDEGERFDPMLHFRVRRQHPLGPWASLQ